MTSPASPLTDAHQAERAEIYGTYVALVPIDLEGSRAFNPGDPVPVPHVERGIVRPDQVAKTTTKAGRAAAGVEENPKG